MESLQPKKKRGCLTSAIIGFVFIAIVGGIISLVIPSVKTGAVPSSSSIVENITKIGTPVDNGKVSIKMNSVKEVESVTDNGLIYKPHDGGKFVTVNLTVKNTGKETYSLLVNNFQIKSSDGKQYSPDTIAIAGDEYLNSVSMNPGLSQTGYIAFEVPKKIKLSTLILEFQEFWSLDAAKFSLTES